MSLNHAHLKQAETLGRIMSLYGKKIEVTQFEDLKKSLGKNDKIYKEDIVKSYIADVNLNAQRNPEKADSILKAAHDELSTLQRVEVIENEKIATYYIKKGSEAEEKEEGKESEDKREEKKEEKPEEEEEDETEQGASLSKSQLAYDILKGGAHKKHKYLTIKDGKYIYDYDQMSSTDHEEAATKHNQLAEHSGKGKSIKENQDNKEMTYHLSERDKHRQLAKEKSDKEVKMNNLDWGKTTQERNNNLDKYDSLKTKEEKDAFVKQLKEGSESKEDYSKWSASDHEKQANLHRENMDKYNKEGNGAMYHREMAKRDMHKELMKKKGGSIVKADDAINILKGSGEGSRGGKVIGHTKTGKPIYEHSFDHGVDHYTKEDHKDASDAHEKEGDKHWKKWVDNKDENALRQSKHHIKLMSDHEEAAKTFDRRTS